MDNISTIIAMSPFLLLVVYGLYCVVCTLYHNARNQQEGDPMTGFYHSMPNLLGYHHSVLVLLVRMGGDSGYTDGEKQTIYSYFGLNFKESAAKRMMEEFQGSRYADVSALNMDEIMKKIRSDLSYFHRFILFSTLYKVAEADGVIEPEELEMIEYFARLAEIQENDYQTMKCFYAKWSSQSSRSKRKSQAKDNTNRRKEESRRADDKSSNDVANGWAYETLGLKPRATEHEIKTAYRKLSMRYHSDHHMNESQEVQVHNTERLLEVQEAYHVLMKNYL